MIKSKIEHFMKVQKRDIFSKLLAHFNNAWINSRNYFAPLTFCIFQLSS